MFLLNFLDTVQSRACAEYTECIINLSAFFHRPQACLQEKLCFSGVSPPDGVTGVDNIFIKRAFYRTAFLQKIFQRFSCRSPTEPLIVFKIHHAIHNLVVKDAFHILRQRLFLDDLSESGDAFLKFRYRKSPALVSPLKLELPRPAPLVVKSRQKKPHLTRLKRITMPDRI